MDMRQDCGELFGVVTEVCRGEQATHVARIAIRGCISEVELLAGYRDAFIRGADGVYL